MTTQVEDPSRTGLEAMPRQVGVLNWDGLSIPVLEVKWADERQWCRHVHDYLTGDGPASSRGCRMHADHPAGGKYCRLTGGKDNQVPCLFDEPLDPPSPGWLKAMRWGKVTLVNEDGTTETALTRVEYATEGAPRAVKVES
jgi:hypothetical protein